MNYLVYCLFFILLISGCTVPVEEKDKSPLEKPLYNYNDFRNRVLHRLAMPEYNPIASQLCYLGPYLDSMYKYDRIVHHKFENYSTISADLYLPDMYVILIDFDNEKFLFSSLLMNSLFRYNNDTNNKEIVPASEKICYYKDVKEFQRMLNYINPADSGSLSRKGIADLLKKCFLTFGLDKTYLRNDTIRNIENREALDNWKKIHLGVYKNDVELSYDSKSIYRPLDRWGLLIFKKSDSCPLSIMKKIYPNTTKVISSADALPNYLNYCDD
ncbi:MAG: hypothetical protein AAFQ94_02020 [Bacteroidota bacterium]